ncbi:MAG: hypothetical protein ACJA0N_001752 [Pseudohongiellaceae bacterium]|jgi:hypothetical protein
MISATISVVIKFSSIFKVVYSLFYDQSAGKTAGFLELLACAKKRADGLFFLSSYRLDSGIMPEKRPHEKSMILTTASLHNEGKTSQANICLVIGCTAFFYFIRYRLQYPIQL